VSLADGPHENNGGHAWRYRVRKQRRRTAPRQKYAPSNRLGRPSIWRVAQLPNETNSAVVDRYDMETGPGVPPGADQLEGVVTEADCGGEQATTLNPQEAEVTDKPTGAVKHLGDDGTQEIGLTARPAAATATDEEDSYTLEW